MVDFHTRGQSYDRELYTTPRVALARFENKYILFYFEKRFSLVGVVAVYSKGVGLAPEPTILVKFAVPWNGKY
jgi:hypothetical protein